MMPMNDELFWQGEWKKDQTFFSNPDDRKKFFITVPWPYTSGPLHVGHGRTYAIADIIARYKRLTGFNVLFPIGFHESGTPIGAISDKIANGDKKTRDMYREYVSRYESPEKVDKVLETFTDPEKVASYFADRITMDFDRLGISIDWRRKFRSIDPPYRKMVEWQFRKLYSLGKIKKGKHALLFSPDEGNPVGEDDIEDGDTNKVSIEDFVSVLFTGKDFSLAASSLRPETIFGITNLWINKNAEYVLTELNNRKIVMSASAARKASLQHSGIKIIDHISVEKIISEKYRVPITGKELSVYPNEMIDPDQATGIVFSVPGHSVNDLEYCRMLGIKIEPVFLIEIDGKDSTSRDALIKHKDADLANAELYKDEFYRGLMKKQVPLVGGKKVSIARDEIKEMLLNEGNCFIFHETSRKARTRNGSPVCVAVIDGQWFIDYSEKEWKNVTYGEVETMRFVPDFYRKNMHDVVDWIGERACARKRGLGTPLPMDTSWVIESLSDSTIYPAFYTIAHIVGKKELSDEDFDYIFLDGKAGKSNSELLAKAKSEFEYWYGVDERITAQPHLSNHLVFYLMNHTAIFDRKHWPGGITIAGTVISNGAKISKSKGNAVSLLDIVNEQGADLFRFYVAVNSDPWSVLDWNQKDVEIVSRKFQELRELIEKSIETPEKDDGMAYSVFRSRFRTHLLKFHSELEKYSIRGAYIEIVYEVMNDLSELRNMGGVPEIAVYSVLDQWIPALSCVMPHFCEKVWKKAGKKGMVSLFHSPMPVLSREDEMLVSSISYTKNLIADIREIQKVTKISASSAEIILCDENTKKDVRKILENDLNVKDKRIIPVVMKSRGKISFDTDEKYALDILGSMIEKTLGIKVEFRFYDMEKDKKMPLPGKPVINLV